MWPVFILIESLIFIRFSLSFRGEGGGATIQGATIQGATIRGGGATILGGNYPGGNYPGGNYPDTILNMTLIS